MKTAIVLKFLKKNSIPIIAIAITIAYLIYKNKIVENYAGCTSEGKMVNDMPENAAEACKRISSRAEEIKAEYDGQGKILQNLPIASLFNPNNYRSGDNTSTDMMRNIINVNLSKCEVEKIHNACTSDSAVSQINLVSFKGCEHICAKLPNGCVASGITQKNTSKTSQFCALTTAITALSEKKSSVDAQALAKVFQQAEGLLSGSNTSQKENCNIINKDLSSDIYLDTKSECLNQLSSTQANEIYGCGSVLNILQENESVALQECMIGTKLEKQDKIDSSASATAKAESEQKTTGITTAASIASSVSSLIFSSIVAVAALVMLNSEGGRETIQSFRPRPQYMY